ncbi:MAG: hypothetical protein FWD66_08220 [Paludibacter sp.]|nr:hypothetical protein [Paludibacter sp.]
MAKTKAISRREFLKKSVLGVGSLLLASSLRAVGNITELSSKISSSSSSQSPPDPDLMNLYWQAKEYFYNKQYSNAVSLFTQLISNNPSSLFLYDGLARVYGAQQNLYAAAELFRQGVASNPQDAFFLHRYGISLRNLCLGNAPAASQFALQNNISNLYQTAAEQLVMANSLNPKTIFQLDLKDFERLAEKYNNNWHHNSPKLYLSEDIISQIEVATSPVLSKWVQTRASRPPSIPAEEDYEHSGGSSGNDNGNGNNGGHGKHSHHSHNRQEQHEREHSQLKNKKRILYSYMRNNAVNNNTAKVEKWGVKILTDDMTDTNSVGYMRKYFKKGKHGDRIVALNRYFYNNNNSIYSALALAASLVKYNNDISSFNEAQELLTTANGTLINLSGIGKGAYYHTLARIREKENNISQARATLIEGVEMMDGKGGVAYTLMEHYATTFGYNESAKAINIQKALCNKQVTEIDDPIWQWIVEYRNFLNENQINKGEKIKALIALAKLQESFNDSGYNATIAEINDLKNS